MTHKAQQTVRTMKAQINSGRAEIKQLKHKLSQCQGNILHEEFVCVRDLNIVYHYHVIFTLFYFLLFFISVYYSLLFTKTLIFHSSQCTECLWIRYVHSFKIYVSRNNIFMNFSSLLISILVAVIVALSSRRRQSLLYTHTHTHKRGGSKLLTAFTFCSSIRIVAKCIQNRTDYRQSIQEKNTLQCAMHEE